MGEAEATVGRIRPDWVLIDIGNTHVKTGLIVAGKLDSVQLRRSLDPSHEAFATIDPKTTNIAVASVYPSALERVKSQANSAGFDFRVALTSDGGIFHSGLVTHDLKTPQTTGVDRVLGCLGALLEAPGEVVIVVDCGTATTINVMTPDRCFRGGMIAPGRRLLSQSLRQGTASLPEIAPDEPLVEIGKSTHTAMKAGVTGAFIGCVRECLSAALKVFPDSKVFLTGGDAETAHCLFPQYPRVDWLTLRGLHWFAVNLGRAT